MNQKKNTKIVVILIIIMLIIIAIGGVVLAYLSTDLFKSNKELFFQYAAQITDMENGNINQYLEKKKTTPYTNEGKFNVNITSENAQEQFKNVNNFNISFSGQTDLTNSKFNQDISLNYSDSVNFPFSYKKIDDTIGLQTKYVGNKFIAVKTDEIDKISEDTESSTEEIVNTFEKIQEATKIDLTEEEKKYIQSTYIGALGQQLNEDSFSKVTETDLVGYRLTLTGEDLKNILVQLLETLKNDQTTLDKINEYLKIQKNSAKITTSDIDDAIESINKDTDSNEQNIEITIYNKNGKTNKLQISIQKNDTKITLQATFDGLETMQNIQENYEIELQFKAQSGEAEQETTETLEGLVTYKYQYSNSINFTDSVNIEEFTSDNAMILTNYEQEQVSNFLNAVSERIREVNKQQMEELGLEENENPLMYIIPSFGIYSTASQAINDTSMSELEINTFNNKFEVYISTNQKGATVKGLLSTISLNNESQDEDRQITEINFCGKEYVASEQNITFIKEDVDLEKSYRVEFEKDQDTGIIYRAVINEK